MAKCTLIQINFIYKEYFAPYFFAQQICILLQEKTKPGTLVPGKTQTIFRPYFHIGYYPLRDSDDKTYKLNNVSGFVAGPNLHRFTSLLLKLPSAPVCCFTQTSFFNISDLFTGIDRDRYVIAYTYLLNATTTTYSENVGQRTRLCSSV
jgi:hypothetical protein